MSVEPVGNFTGDIATYHPAVPTSLTGLTVNIYTGSSSVGAGRIYNDGTGAFAVESRGHGSGYCIVNIPIDLRSSINRIIVSGAGNDGLIYINGATTNTALAKNTPINIAALFPAGISTITVKAGTDAATTHVGTLFINFTVADTVAPTILFLTLPTSVLV